MTSEQSSPSSPSSAGDSYIGCLISLTSKSEIRYEGVLAAIDPKESTIALRNVRSYGTEGRKKDGPQIPPSNNMYEYILFRGADIKDLQVKSSSADQTKPQMSHDPAIIQSQNAHATTSYPPVLSSGGGILTGTTSHAAQSALGNLPFPDTSLYQTGGHPGSWVSPALPINANGSSFTEPMYSQGYAGLLSGQSQDQQHSVPFQPLPVMQQNQLQHPEGNAPTGMPTLSGLAAPSNRSISYPADFSLSLPSSIYNPADSSLSLPSSIYNPADSSLSLSNTNSLLSRPLSSLPSHLPALSSFSPYNQELNISMNPISSKAGIASTSVLPVPSVPYPFTTVPLITPDQSTKSVPQESSSLQQLYPEQKDIGSLLPSSSSNVSSFVGVLPQVPLLPLPLPSQQGKQAVSEFTEEFDFTAMNEKFNKYEVWGSLGKQRGTIGDGTEGDLIHDHVELEGGFDQDPRFRNKPVYNKDDFFDTLSCNSLNRGGRTRFSERMRRDTETFGGFQQRPPVGRGNYTENFGGFQQRPSVSRGNYTETFRGFQQKPSVGRDNYTDSFGGFHHRPPVGHGNYGPSYSGNRGSYNRGRGSGYYGREGHGVYRPF